MGLEKDKIKQLLQKEDPIILELGAHNGSDTKEFLDQFRGIKIYCFEPDPRNIAVFKKLIKDNRCVLEEAAVSNRDGEAILRMSTGWPYGPGPRWAQVLRLSKVYSLLHRLLKRKEWTASSSITESIPHSDDHPWLTFDKVAKVEIVKLDTWVRRRGVVYIDFIWMDVQGAEREVIEGAVETLKFTKYVLTEYGEGSTYPQAMTREETVLLMRKHNFELMPEYSLDVGQMAGDLLFRNRH